jgi:hypothetical protein
MVVDVELTRRASDHYAARALQFPEVIVEAGSREAALAQLRAALLARRRPDTEIVQITIEPGSSAATPTTWPQHAGAFPDDDAYRTMLAEIERQRRVLTGRSDKGALQY